MHRQRLFFVVNSVMPPRWRRTPLAFPHRLRPTLSAQSLLPYLWLVVIYLCVLCAFRAAMH